MRSVAYIVAVVAAIGIMIGIATMPESGSGNPSPASSVATSESVTPVSTLDEPGELSLHIPDMHCIYACYPSVKETLENTEAVKSVELAKQKEEGTIDNPTVIVNYESGFDLASTLAKLKSKGFKSDVVQ